MDIQKFQLYWLSIPFTPSPKCYETLLRGRLIHCMSSNFKIKLNNFSWKGSRTSKASEKSYFSVEEGQTDTEV